MPKLKTKSSVKRRFSRTATGKLKRKFAFTSHMMKNKSKKRNLKARGTTLVSEPDAKLILKNWMPYARKKKKSANKNSKKEA